MAEGGPYPSRFKERRCTFCGEAFRTPEPMKRYCSAACRGKADEERQYRRKHGGPSKVDISPPNEGG